MRILFLGNVGNRVGAFTHSCTLAANRLGMEFHIAASWTGYDNIEDRKADEDKYNIKIHQVDFARNPFNPQNIKAYRQVIDLIKKEQIDVIHCSTPIGGVVGRIAGRRCKIKKVIYQVHGFHFYKGAPVFNWLIYYPVERMLAHLTDVIITTNHEDWERAKSFHLRSNGKKYYVPGVGLDFKRFENTTIQQRKKKRKELGIRDDDFLVFSCGDLNKNKNHSIIIQAIETINCPHIKYLIAGRGELKGILEEQIRRDNKQDNIKLLGYRTDIPELCKAADVFAFPSLREGFGMASIEAMATGCPIIASRIRGVTEYVIDGFNGILCNPHSLDEFIKAIDTLYYNEELRKQYSTNAKVGLEKFSQESISNQIENIYKEELL